MIHKLLLGYVFLNKIQSLKNLIKKKFFQEKCGAEPKMESLFSKYTECNDRVNGRSRTTETCTEELFDYLHELDHCVSKTLWSKLK